ncbi:hypothetical protein CY34DRAFT_96685, partial [Suillus luteus UH-Slu-Lm8-n1]
EHEMCQYLEWELNVDPVILREFEDMVKKYFIRQLTILTFFPHHPRQLLLLPQLPSHLLQPL